MSGILSAFIGRVAGVVTDAYFNLVTLLLPGNGTNGAQNNTFLDSSTNNFTITRNGNTTQGTFSPFSQTGWSNYFDGTSDYLTAVGSNLALGTGDFTIEFWFYANAYSITTDSSAMFDSRSGNNTTGFQIGPVFNDVDKLTVGQNTSPIITSSTTYPLNTWVHCAVVRSSGTIVLYQNGVNVGSVANTTNNSTTTNYIGSGHWQPTAAGATFNGYLSNFRISNTARYTSGFTPPTTPFSSDANTRLLACQSNRFVDSSSNGYAVTPYGTPSVQAFSPFAPTAEYSAATVGGSGYFDGTGDYLSIASNSAFGFGTGDFTVEFWAYPTTFVNYSQWVSTRVADDASYWGVDSNSSGVFYIFTNGTVVSSSAQPKNAWIHIAAVRSSGTVKFYINGVSAGSASLTNNFLNANGLGIGAAANGAQTMYGYISNVRLIKGQALTTGDFTPPTAPVTTSAVGWTGTNVASSITGSVAVLANFTNAGITDATAKNDLETVGNAQISTTQSKFGGSSMYFDGTGDYLVVGNMSTNPNLALLSSDFTIEFWYYPLNTNIHATLNNLDDNAGNGSLWILLNGTFSGGSKVQFGYNTGGANGNVLFGTGTFTTNQWHHIAICRSGSNLRCFINGTQEGSTSTALGTSSIVAYNRNLVIGATLSAGSYTAYNLNGYLDDFRVTKFARYTTNFTAPTSAFALQ